MPSRPPNALKRTQEIIKRIEEKEKVPQPAADPEKKPADNPSVHLKSIERARRRPYSSTTSSTSCLSPIFIPDQDRPRRPALLTLLFLYTAASYR